MNRIVWKGNGALIVRHFAGCYSLCYRGKLVMPQANFHAVSRYLLAEFLV